MTEKILESPGWKTFFSVVIPIVVGVFSGTLVTELTTSTGLNWSVFYKTVSFYGLLIVATISYIYFRAVYMYERQIDRFLDDDYCRAYMRSKCLPEAAERYKELIRSGQKGDLTSAMKEFEKLLK
ncbi:MAG: hypothetical protein IPJ12_07400 [Betaproteobacteria bacterium]|nr:hypothetical protein [Betaproteobacteria bacterium]